MMKSLRFVGIIVLTAFLALNTSAQEKKVEKAQKFYSKGELERVLQTLSKTKVSKEDYYYRNYLKLKGNALYELGQTDEALKVYQQAIDELNIRKVHESIMLRYLDIKFNEGEFDVCLDLLAQIKPIKGAMYRKKPFAHIEEMCLFSKNNSTDQKFTIGYDSITRIQVWDDLDLGENVVSFGGAFYYDSLIFSAYTEYEERSEWELAANEGAVNDDVFEITNLDFYVMPLDKSKEQHLFSQQIAKMNNEGALCFNGDFTRMFFTRHYVAPSGRENFKIHYAEQNKKGEWVDQGPLNISSDKYSIMQPQLSPDGSTMYFVSDKPGGRGKLDIYYAKGSKNKWSQPVNAGAGINTAGDEIYPYMRNDSILIFASNGLIGFGGFDLQYVNITKKPYLPRNMMTPINSNYNEYCMIGHYQRPDRMVFFSERGREGGTVHASILQEDAGAASPVPYLVDVIELPKPMKNIDNEFEPSDITAPNLNLAANSLKPEEVKEEVAMSDEIKKELESLQFQFNSATLQYPAKETLKELPAFLKANPDVRLVISGHTDLIGTEEYNMYLSTERSRETYRYLTKELGLAPEMFVVESNGKYFPKVETMDRQVGEVNRRVEFKMVRQNPEQGITMRFKPHDEMPELINNLEALFLENSNGDDVVADVHEIKVRDIYRAKDPVDLSEVASYYNIDINRIKQVNNLSVNALTEREMIIIPL